MGTYRGGNGRNVLLFIAYGGEELFRHAGTFGLMGNSLLAFTRAGDIMEKRSRDKDPQFGMLTLADYLAHPHNPFGVIHAMRTGISEHAFDIGADFLIRYIHASPARFQV